MTRRWRGEGRGVRGLRKGEEEWRGNEVMAGRGGW